MKTNLTNIPSETSHQGTVWKKPLIRQDEKNGRVATYNYGWLEKGMTLSPHAHPDGEEYFLFLEGTGEMSIGENWFPVTSGDFITIPQGSTHSMRNTENLKLVFISLRTTRKDN